MKAEDMRVNDNAFSGIIIRNYTDGDEVINYNGKVSEDKQMMEFIEFTKDFIQYPTGKREIIEKEVTLSARFENIPIRFGIYKFKYGVTKIASVKYNEEYYRPYSGGLQTHTESFVKINEDKITEHTTNCVSAFFKPGVLKLELKDDAKIAVIAQSNEIEGTRGSNVMIGLSALIDNELRKIPGLVVLERQKMYKLLEEIKSSESGIVNEETAVESDKMLMPDIEIIITQENRVPDDYSLPFESYKIRSKIRIVETGQIIDPNLIYNVDLNVKLDQDFEEYVKKVSTFAVNLLYE